MLLYLTTALAGIGDKDRVVEVDDDHPQLAGIIAQGWGEEVLEYGDPAHEQAAQARAAGFEPGDPNAVLSTTPGPETPELPASDARKSEWEAYARSIGIDVDGLTKAEIVDAVQSATD